MFCVCVVVFKKTKTKKTYQLTLQYLDLSVINPLYTVSLQQISKKLCLFHDNQPPLIKEQCFLVLFSFSVGILPEGTVFPNLNRLR